MIKKTKKQPSAKSKKELRENRVKQAADKFQEQYNKLVDAKVQFADLLGNSDNQLFNDKILGDVMEYDKMDLTEYFWSINFDAGTSELELCADLDKESLEQYPADGAEYVFDLNGQKTTFTYKNDDDLSWVEPIVLNIFLLDEQIIMLDSKKCLSDTGYEDECDC